ncbi:hypothetical protein RRG08_002971 [Elysia crispata]|uniref:Uncharacterized protein n=1 Tax=Elysia crispata TaxID=231223 RepID=A0AAE0XQE8_9GAST|nr:hypothetical protein RRG08_002971 [Elysia crispata]
MALNISLALACLIAKKEQDYIDRCEIELSQTTSEYNLEHEILLLEKFSVIPVPNSTSKRKGVRRNDTSEISRFELADLDYAISQVETEIYVDVCESPFSLLHSSTLARGLFGTILQWTTALLLLHYIRDSISDYLL